MPQLQLHSILSSLVLLLALMLTWHAGLCSGRISFSANGEWAAVPAAQVQDLCIDRHMCEYMAQRTLVACNVCGMWQEPRISTR
jgi:hypothetical protein